MPVPRSQMAGWAVLAALLAYPAWAAPATSPVTLIVRDSAGTPVPDAVVYLQGDAAKIAGTPKPVVVDQRDQVFVPAVTVIQAGTEVSFPNSDSISHHVYSFANPNAFELPLYKGRRSPTVRFEKAGVVTLGCNIHDSMVGWIVVVDTPHFGKTSEQGMITLPDVPAGRYEAFVWSPRLDPARPISAGILSMEGALQPQTLAIRKRMRALPVAGALADGDY